MFSDFLKSLSILKKFLFINLVIFLIIGFLTVLYISNAKPNLIKNKTTKHIQIIDNTIEHILRLNIKFEEEDIRRFLFSTRFLFQNLDRVILFDNQYNLVGDTDTLDLDPRSFSSRLDIVELEILDKEKSKRIIETKNINKEKTVSLKDILTNYSWSKDYGKPFTFTQEGYDQFLLTTVKNITLNEVNIGYLVITENANDIKSAINERKTFILRTAIFIGIVIFIFSFVFMILQGRHLVLILVDVIFKFVSSIKKENLEIIQKRLTGWQLESFKESYTYKIENGISLFKKKLLDE